MSWGMIVWGELLSSVCCLASSATASAILALTVETVSEAKHCSNLARIASRSAGCRVRNRSTVFPCSVLRGFEDWRRKMTAANDRVCGRLRQNVPRAQNRVMALTEVSFASCICSERPINSTSGLSPTHSRLSCSSAAVRSTLSGACRPLSRLARAVWMSAGRTDMASVVCGVVSGGPRSRCGLWEVRTARQGNLVGSPISSAYAYGKTRARGSGPRNGRFAQEDLFRSLQSCRALSSWFCWVYLLEAGCFGGVKWVSRGAKILGKMKSTGRAPVDVLCPFSHTSANRAERAKLQSNISARWSRAILEHPCYGQEFARLFGFSFSSKFSLFMRQPGCACRSG